MTENLPTGLIAGEWEGMVLANVMRGSGLTGDFLSALTVDDFAIEKHRRVWAKIQQIHACGSTPALDVVCGAFHESGDLAGVDGISGLLALSENYVTLTESKQWVKLLRRLAIKRRIYALSGGVQAEIGAGCDANLDGLRELERELDAVDGDDIQEPGTIADALDSIGGIDALFRKPKNTIPWPHPGMNRYSNGGIEPDTFWLLAARPSTGKSALAAEIALHAARHGPVHFYSLEMGKRKILLRLVAHETEIPLSWLLGGNLHPNERTRVQAALSNVASLPLSIFTDDLGLESIVRRIVRERPRLAIIDYIGLLEANSKRKAENRNQEVSGISRRLKMVPQREGVPILALSQLNRGMEHGGKRRPVLSDLRESGSLEQDADGVVFLYDADAGQKEKRRGGLIDLQFAKQRDGVRDAYMDLKFEPQFMRFRELDTSGQPG